MNIRDIAAAAGVSPSTVSKVLNKKDKDISESTRLHVLKIIREYQYSPYANIRETVAPGNSHTFAAVILDQNYYTSDFLCALETTASENGFNLLLCCVDGANSAEIERRIKILHSRRVEGIILCTHSEPALKEVLSMVDGEIPLVAVTSFSMPNTTTVRFDFSGAAQDAVSNLILLGHQRIGFVLDRQDHSVYTQVYNGIITAFSASSLPLSPQNIVYCQPNKSVLDMDLQSLLNRNVTAIYCQTAHLITAVQNYLLHNEIRIPQAISLVCGMAAPQWGNDAMTAYLQPYQQVARTAVKLLVEAVSSSTPPQIQDVRHRLTFRKGTTLAAPTGQEAPFIILGNCAFDTILNVPKLPQNTQLVACSNVVMSPGGKCFSQSVAVARLGGSAYTIGRVGNDQEGSTILNALRENNVHTDGIVVDSTAATGHSYLTTTATGEHTILSYSGANRYLDSHSIKKVQHLLPSAFACLITTEVPFSVVKTLIQKCIPHRVLIFMKPSEAIVPDPMIMRHIDYLVPNELELEQLIPEGKTVQEKAELCYQMGCKNVIVTLSSNGCYLKNAQYSCHIPAANFQPVETASAANCFIGALAVSLSQNNDLFYAISYATYAAGISISQYGMYSSFPTKQQMDLYQEEINGFYREVVKHIRDGQA